MDISKLKKGILFALESFRKKQSAQEALERLGEEYGLIKINE